MAKQRVCDIDRLHYGGAAVLLSVFSASGRDSWMSEDQIMIIYRSEEWIQNNDHIQIYILNIRKKNMVDTISVFMANLLANSQHFGMYYIAMYNILIS